MLDCNPSFAQYPDKTSFVITQHEPHTNKVNINFNTFYDQQPNRGRFGDLNDMPYQQPDAFLQAPPSGNSPSVDTSTAHTPLSAQSNGAQANGRPTTPSSGVFARLGVPTTRPTPHGPDSRGRPLPYPQPSPSATPPTNPDEHPPGFATSMRVPSTTAAPRQPATESDPHARMTSVGQSMQSDSMQTASQATADNPQEGSPHPQPARQGNGDSGSSKLSGDLPPGFAQHQSWATQAGTSGPRSNGGLSSATPAQTDYGANANSLSTSAAHGTAEQASLSWAEEAAEADDANEEFPGLSFGIRNLDQHKKATPPDSQQDFPSLGGAAGPDKGPKPAGAWGRGSGSLKLQQNQIAASLVAASQTPQSHSSPAVHVEHLELSARLRVAGDDVADSVRRRRAKRHEYERWENVRGLGNVNIVQGLELYENVLSPDEQANMIAMVEDWVLQGKQGRLRGRTFSAPRKWAKGKGRITCQFGCCYNYAVDREGRQPGIVAEEVVEKMPPVLLSLCKRLVRWGILPKAKEPDTAIVNVYESEDCIPPHIDHHDFDRPFCTISLLSEESIMFGAKIISRGPGDFACDYQIPLPKGSCLVLKGNGADVAQHCVPPVSSRRVSITLRRMADVHARRVVAMAEKVHAGLPVEYVDTSSAPKRISANDAYDMDERQQSEQRPGRRYR